MHPAGTRPKASDIAFLSEKGARGRNRHQQNGQKWLANVEYAHTEQRGRVRGKSSAALGQDWRASQQIMKIGNKSDQDVIDDEYEVSRSPADKQ